MQVFFFFYKRLAEVGARSRWCTKTKCTRCFETGVKVVDNILPKLHNSLLPGLEGPLSYPLRCDSISQSIVLIKSTDKKGTVRVVSQMYHVLLPLWFRCSHTRSLNTLLFIRLWALVQGVRWLGVAVLQMCGCALVCSDSPSCLGLQDKHHAHRVLGGNGVESLHGDGPQAQPLLSLMMPPAWVAPHALDCKAGAVAQWGIEAEAILCRGLHYAQVDCRGLGGVGVAANS